MENVLQTDVTQFRERRHTCAGDRKRERVREIERGDREREEREGEK